MTEPMRLEMMREEWDCGPTCLAILLGLDYPVVRRRFRKDPNGVSVRQLQNVARKLGRSLHYSRTFEDDEIGILDLQRESDDGSGKWEGHYAIYLCGVVYNPAQGVTWADLESFMKNHRWSVCGLLTRVEA